MIDEVGAAPEGIGYDSPPGQNSETLGARTARVSRAAQGLPTSIENAAVLQQLQVLCNMPRPRNYSGAPDELDSLGE